MLFATHRVLRLVLWGLLWWCLQIMQRVCTKWYLSKIIWTLYSRIGFELPNRIGITLCICAVCTKTIPIWISFHWWQALINNVPDMISQHNKTMTPFDLDIFDILYSSPNYAAHVSLSRCLCLIGVLLFLSRKKIFINPRWKFWEVRTYVMMRLEFVRCCIWRPPT